jgi:hypothetical protein
MTPPRTRLPGDPRLVPPPPGSERAVASPDRCAVALLILDVINGLAFPGGERFFRE